MKTEFTKNEAEEFISRQMEENDLVRLVDPVSRKVIDENDAGGLLESCHSLWGRCDRCENCTSMRALKTGNKYYKIELLNGHTFWVQSRFMRIDGKPCVAEIVSDVTGNFIMDTDQRDELGSIIRSYNRQLITDSMTGVYNRRFLDEDFVPSISCCRDHGVNVNLAIMDLDSFKKVNDSYGHQAGDMLLRDVAGFWRLHFDSRKKENERIVVRYGGDELLIISCGQPPEDFRREVGAYYAQMRRICYYTNEIQIPFSITFGFASSQEFGDGWEWTELFDTADRRLYDSKSERAE